MSLGLEHPSKHLSLLSRVLHLSALFCHLFLGAMSPVQARSLGITRSDQACAKHASGPWTHTNPSIWHVFPPASTWWWTATHLSEFMGKGVGVSIFCAASLVSYGEELVAGSPFLEEVGL